YVRIDIYNLMGERIATLAEGPMSAGEHSVIWDASGYSSGIYFYKLTAGEKTFTKRMTLLK
ncbi:MAG: peptidase S8, partial [candidate division Zixibacteria bacterium CG_4_9_14_3_um_filter_46_8]